ncbi:MAG: thioredoxin family protein [Bacteroidales bacterium]|nr:thioredoxin family protein [Bacteroidales bacterium]
MALIQATDSTFNDLLSQNDKVVIKYYADWCGSCKLFAPKFRRLSDDSRFEGVTFLDINAEQNPEARKLAGVNNLPFFAVFKDGMLVQGEATSKEENVVAMIEAL